MARGAICNLETRERERTIRWCPLHKQDEEGLMVYCYDTHRMFFDCGVMADYGYGYWTPPKRRYCEVCKKDVAWAYYRKHIKTARHLAKAASGD